MTALPAESIATVATDSKSTPETGRNEKAPQLSPTMRIGVIWLIALLCLAGFMFWNLHGKIGFALALRGGTVGAILVAAFCQSVATVMFHTVTGNRILTPSVMGFDNLFVLMQTLLVTLFGGTILVQLDGIPMLVLQTLLMVGFATLLYRWLFTTGKSGLYTTLLVGMVLGAAFATVSTFLERLLSPTDYDLLSLELFGRITAVDASLLPLAFGVCGVIGFIAWRRRHILDTMLLGRELATSLGVNHRRELTIMIVLVSILCAFSTALVGPMTFFGFLVATLAYEIAGTHRHSHVLPVAFGLGVIFLAGGQFILQHIFYAAGFLTVIIEFVGGLAFLSIVIRGRKL